MRCLITNAEWAGTGSYSPEGLRLLDRRLQSLAPLPFTREQLIEEAAARAVKMSIQGMQPKISAVLHVSEGRMEIVDTGGLGVTTEQAHDVGFEVLDDDLHLLRDVVG